MKKLLKTIVLLAFIGFFFACSTNEVNPSLEDENRNLEYTIKEDTRGPIDCPSCLELGFLFEQTFGVKVCSYDFEITIPQSPSDCPFSPGANTVFIPISTTWDFGDGTLVTQLGSAGLSTTHVYGGTCPDKGTVVTVDMTFNIFDPFASGGPDLGDCNRIITHTFQFN